MKSGAGTFFAYITWAKKSTRELRSTDKWTDVWSRDFIIWKINSGQWDVVWADYERLLRPVFSLFRGQKFFLNFFENNIASAMKSYIIRFFIFWTWKSEKIIFFCYYYWNARKPRANQTLKRGPFEFLN